MPPMPSCRQFIEDYNHSLRQTRAQSHDAHRAVRAGRRTGPIFAWRESGKSQSLTLHYERKCIYRPIRRQPAVIGKYLEIFQYPDGRIEIPGGGGLTALFHLQQVGAVDQGAIVDNKRLGQVLRTAQIVQAQRDDRVICRPSTAHRVDGTPIPKSKIAGTKRQRELSVDDLHAAINNTRFGERQRKDVTCQ